MSYDVNLLLIVSVSHLFICVESERFDAFVVVVMDQINGLPDSMLQGEVVKASLSIRNLGEATASSIFLKTNVAWVHVGEVKS